MPAAAWIALGGVFVTLTLHGAIFAYFLGRLTQRVESLEKETSADAGLNAKVIRLEVQMEGVNTKLASLERHMEGVSRQLANLATGKGFAPLMTDRERDR